MRGARRARRGLDFGGVRQRALGQHEDREREQTDKPWTHGRSLGLVGELDAVDGSSFAPAPQSLPRTRDPDTVLDGSGAAWWHQGRIPQDHAVRESGRQDQTGSSTEDLKRLSVVCQREDRFNPKGRRTNTRSEPYAEDTSGSSRRALLSRSHVATPRGRGRVWVGATSTSSTTGHGG